MEREAGREDPRTILVTGAAGFIGFHLSRRLLDGGCRVVGVDNLNDYYEVSLKLARLGILEKYDNFTFHKFDIMDRGAVEGLFQDSRFDCIVSPCGSGRGEILHRPIPMLM